MFHWPYLIAIFQTRTEFEHSSVAFFSFSLSPLSKLFMIITTKREKNAFDKLAHCYAQTTQVFQVPNVTKVK